MKSMLDIPRSSRCFHKLHRLSRSKHGIDGLFNARNLKNKGRYSYELNSNIDLSMMQKSTTNLTVITLTSYYDFMLIEAEEYIKKNHGGID